MAILFLSSVGGEKAKIFNNNLYRNICTDIKIIQTEAAAWQRDQHTQKFNQPQQRPLVPP